MDDVRTLILLRAETEECAGIHAALAGFEKCAEVAGFCDVRRRIVLDTLVAGELPRTQDLPVSS